ncbi:MAG TPA: fluoride efflux transporter CrcB [Acidimicrobiales bacterium]|nr:fluoride efflux transporter CrcB [Acidimicrobiales bacterium]
MSRAALLALVAAGAVGASARHLVDGFVRDRTAGLFPWGILTVNVTGSLLVGLLTGLGLFHAFPETPRAVLGTGFCGAYTTFSTVTLDTVRLIEEGAVDLAFRNALGTLVVCAGAAAAGVALAAL